MSTVSNDRVAMPRAPVARKNQSNARVIARASRDLVRTRDREYLWQNGLTSLPLLAADFVAVVLASAFLVGVGTLWSIDAAISLVGSTGLLLVVHLLVCAGVGLYPGTGLNTVAEMRVTTRAATITSLVAMVAVAMSSRIDGSSLVLVGLLWAALSILSPVCRLLARTWAAGQSWWGQPLLIFGGGTQGASTYHTLLSHPTWGLRPIGIIDDLHNLWGDGDWDESQLDPKWYLGNFDSASETIVEQRVFWGAAALTGRDSAEITGIVDGFAAMLPHLLILPCPAHQARGGDLRHGMTVVQQNRIDVPLLLPGPCFLKRSMDLAMTIVGGILISPLLVMLALAVRLSSPGPIFYGQERIGRGEHRFKAWKFRSMVMNADGVLKDYLAKHPELQAEWDRDHKLKNDPRVTWIGRILRKTSLDELPQLWNVLRGDMSLVGPRPIVQAEITKYSNVYPVYLRVRPGITGLWQVSGRNNTTYEERVNFDDCYVRNWSPWLDLCILVRTISVVLFQHGAY